MQDLKMPVVNVGTVGHEDYDVGTMDIEVSRTGSMTYPPHSQINDHNQLRRTIRKVLTTGELADEFIRVSNSMNNEPCMCGSKRKFKKCCKGKLSRIKREAGK